MTFWEYLRTRCQQLLMGAYQHAGAVFPWLVVATVLGVLIGFLIYRTEWAGNLAIITMTANILTVPSLTLLGLLAPVVGLGVAPSVIALRRYGLLPVVARGGGARHRDVAAADVVSGRTSLLRPRGLEVG